MDWLYLGLQNETILPASFLLSSAEYVKSVSPLMQKLDKSEKGGKMNV